MLSHCTSRYHWSRSDTHKPLISCHTFSGHQFWCIGALSSRHTSLGMRAASKRASTMLTCIVTEPMIKKTSFIVGEERVGTRAMLVRCRRLGEHMDIARMSTATSSPRPHQTRSNHIETTRYNLILSLRKTMRSWCLWMVILRYRTFESPSAKPP